MVCVYVCVCAVMYMYVHVVSVNLIPSLKLAAAFEAVEPAFQNG